jgi:hypothetical protein
MQCNVNFSLTFNMTTLDLLFSPEKERERETRVRGLLERKYIRNSTLGE